MRSVVHAYRLWLAVADLWKVPKGNKAIGTATGGSSEAIMLGGLALKKAWQERRKATGKDYYHPNIVMGANAQVALEKFARYFDVEVRRLDLVQSSAVVSWKLTVSLVALLLVSPRSSHERGWVCNAASGCDQVRRRKYHRCLCCKYTLAIFICPYFSPLNPNLLPFGTDSWKYLHGRL